MRVLWGGERKEKEEKKTRVKKILSFQNSKFLENQGK